MRSEVIPFTLGVVTDGDEATLSDVANKGFCSSANSLVLKNNTSMLHIEAQEYE